MIKHHVLADDKDDIYGGFEEYNSRLEEENFLNDPGFQHAVKATSHGRKPPVLGRNLSTAATRAAITTSLGRLQTGVRLTTAAGSSFTDGSRPMTSVRAAGYSSMGRRMSSALGPGTGQTPPELAAAPPLETKSEDSPEERIRAMEKGVNQLIEESCIAACRGEITIAFEKAKEAGRKERVLVRQREQLGVADQINLDLTYSVLFNLANRYTASGMYQEALNTYQAIVRNKLFAHAGRLKVNIGNIYFAQKNYSKAIKFYRMGLDQLPNTHKSMRIKIMQNIGITFVKLGQFSEAITSFEHIMQEEPDVKTGFNLILCYFLTGDRNKMKYAFQQLLRVDLHLDDEDRYLSHNDDKQYELILEVIRNDELRLFEKKRKAEAENFIKLAAKLIAPAIESNFNTGYDWCIEQVKMSMYHEIANDLEIDKAVMYLKQRDFHQDGGKSLHTKAIETLKSFERKDARVASTAATNLSFLHFLEGDLTQADRYADQALAADRYNPSALVNKGNVLFKQQNYERARDCYAEALQDDSSCVEALYNLGLVCKKLERYEEALEAFFKLHAVLRNSAPVVYQIMDIYEKIDDSAQAQEWAMQLHGLVPSDPFLLQRLGDNYEQEGDKSQAFSYYYDSFKYFPCNFDVIEWLGAYYIESQFCEKAIAYFERASLMQPNQTKWLLMIASCHRRSGNYQQALETYKTMHRQFPDNIDCLRFLVRLCADMGLPEAQEYANRLKRAEKMKEAREQRQLSASSRRGGGTARPNGSRENSASASSGGDSREGSAKRDLARMALMRGNIGALPKQPETNDETLHDADQGSSGSFIYSDPLGPAAERPKTAARSRPVQDEFADEEVDDALLPD
ncbi:Intraflagellar transport protein 88 [Clonorchis sinensis]|uniref:Intraflagellar transport protein 88 n=2 Tax=Clonorchis sinensis TaxID=79923 RepID=A0A8T1MMF2_CLOSI|nr:Intraflagellar transport protein 88 [Clonorchis sinensis]GAA31648.2 intraflagellar transport protein 88 homolog [Clonorchis sinensis]